MNVTAFTDEAVKDKCVERTQRQYQLH